MDTVKVRRVISFSRTMNDLVGLKASRLGLTFSEFLKSVLSREISDEAGRLPVINEETEKKIGKALREYKEGKYVVAKSRSDIEKILGV